MFHKLTLEDCAALASFDASLPEGELRRNEAEFQGFLSQPAALAYGCREGDRLVAYVLFTYAVDTADLCHIATLAWARGRGYGRQLLTDALQALAARGVKEVFLEVKVGNIAAENLYARLGGVQVGTRPGYYTLPDGSRADARVLHLLTQQA